MGYAGKIVKNTRSKFCVGVCEWKYRLLLFLALFWLGERTASTLLVAALTRFTVFKFFCVWGPGKWENGNCRFRW